MKLPAIKFQQDIYLTSLQEISSSLSSKEQIHLSNAMTRISNGLKESSHQYTKMIDKLYQEMIQIKFRTSMEVQKINRQFQEFRDKNNLDEYFEKTLTDETRKNTLKLVADLMHEDLDWMEKLMEYKQYLDKLQYSDTETKLQTFHDDLINAQKGRLAIFADQN